MIVRGLGLAVLLAASGAEAADLALVIGNEQYEQAETLRSGDEVVSAARALSRAGVEVLSVDDGTQPEMIDALAGFLRAAPTADGVVAVLSGRFLSTATDTYLLPVESDGPALSELPAQSLPVSLVLAALAEAEGPALLVLASDDEDTRFGEYVQAGLGEVRTVDGVPIVVTTPIGAANLVFSTLAKEGALLRPEVLERDDTRVIGTLPSDFTFIDRLPPREEREDELWRIARESDSAAAYREYLDAFPRGRHALEASIRLEGLQNDPIAQARRTEQDLSLSASARRQIQRNLTLLGYNTRGIDGIFGRGTRSAVSSWQEANGFRVTGYIDQSQINTLERQAAARAAQLEAEAAERRAATERDDRDYWDRTGALGGEANFRAYLERFPDGRYAEIAQNRLDQIEERRRDEAADAERVAWDRANREDTIASYQSYLDRYPDGAFRGEAVARRDALRRAQGDADTIAAARAQEQQLGLNPFTARIVEERLNALGLRPGPVDGQFDETTRRALRRYQQDRGIPASGYLNEPTMVRLLADSIGNLLR